MARNMSFAAIAALLAVAWAATPKDAQAQGYGQPGWTIPEPNYYAQPAGPDGLTAAMYPSPRPTPPLVGQTYITYEPLSPHEFLYVHHQVYDTPNENGSTRTTITWNHRPTLWPFHPNLRSSVPAVHIPASGPHF